MASVFLYHVVGDLTVGKPELLEFTESETLESAIKAIGESTEAGIAVWKQKTQKSLIENAEMRQQRFVGILNALDIVAFLAKDEHLADQDNAMKTPVSHVVVPNSSLLKEVDPATRMIDALEMMKQGVKQLLVPKSVVWRGMSKRFSVLFNGKWLKNVDTNGGSSMNIALGTNRPSSSSTAARRDKFCCLSREDLIRFVIGCLGALAPLPLTSISSLGAINTDYASIEAARPAIEATAMLPLDPCAIAVVETASDGQIKIIGDISSYKLWKCDHLAAAWALANLSAGQFVTGVEDNITSRSSTNGDLSLCPLAGDSITTNSSSSGSGPGKVKKFSSRSIGFFSSQTSFAGKSMYRGRSAPLTCKNTSSLAAVMAQMLSHRASHVWVTDAEDEEVLVGVIGYVDILAAVTRQPPAPTTFLDQQAS